MKFAPLLVVFIVCFDVAPAYARKLPNWPYERLMREADVVVVATPISTREIDFDFSKYKDFALLLKVPQPLGREIFDQLRARVTTFKVIGMLRGESRASVDVLHFYWNKDVPLNNGPNFIEFTARGKSKVKVDNKNSGVKPEILLFLRLWEGTHPFLLEPVSGQYDPDLSVRILSKKP